MKRILVYIFLLQCFALFSGCEKEMMAYEGKEGVYFAVQSGDAHRSPNSWPYQPDSEVNFVRIGQDEAAFPLKVSITGPTKDYDRVFYMEVNPDSTTAVLGTHYQAVQREWNVPAGATYTTVNVLLKRAPTLEENPVTLGLRLVAASDLALSFPEWEAAPGLDGGRIIPTFDASLHTLRINDIMVRPEEWSGSVRSDNSESGLFGLFTRRKMEFLMENLGLKYEDFDNAEKMPMARMMLISSDGANLLMKRFNEGNPVLEEDGRLMWMGTVPWKSFVGVPWIPGNE